VYDDTEEEGQGLGVLAKAKAKATVNRSDHQTRGAGRGGSNISDGGAKGLGPSGPSRPVGRGDQREDNTLESKIRALKRKIEALEGDEDT